MILAPRSWPSRPGFATRIRILRELSAISGLLQKGHELRRRFGQRRAAQDEAGPFGQFRECGWRIVTDGKCGAKSRSAGGGECFGHTVHGAVEGALFDDVAEAFDVLFESGGFAQPEGVVGGQDERAAGAEDAGALAEGRFRLAVAA